MCFNIFCTLAITGIKLTVQLTNTYSKLKIIFETAFKKDYKKVVLKMSEHFRVNNLGGVHFK